MDYDENVIAMVTRAGSDDEAEAADAAERAARKHSGMALLVTSIAAITQYETKTKASRQAHRWLHRGVIQWATILDPKTGAALARYVRRADGRVERMQ